MQINHPTEYTPCHFFNAQVHSCGLITPNLQYNRLHDVDSNLCADSDLWSAVMHSSVQMTAVQSLLTCLAR